jgi:heme A synthase
VARAVSVPLHLVNTLVLLAGLTLTIFWLSGGDRLRFRARPELRFAIIAVGVGMLVIGATGAVTALADTLFPKDFVSLDLSGEEHFLTNLRVIHPVVSVAIGVIAAMWARWHALPAGGRAALAGRLVIGLVALQFAGGVVNILLGTPVWLSLFHLLLADALWISWVWMAAELLQDEGMVPPPDTLTSTGDGTQPRGSLQ